MIYFIDEERWLVKPFCDELKRRDYAVRNITMANEAYRELADPGPEQAEVDLVIIDVMLATDPDDELSQTLFTRAETDDFLRTGLVLLKLLVEKRPDIFPSRAVIFSGAGNSKLVERIEKVCKGYSIAFLKKGEYVTGFDFADAIEKIISDTSPARKGINNSAENTRLL